MHNNSTEEYDEALIQREMLKLYLDTIFLNYENVADQVLNKAIDFQRETYKKHRFNLITLSKKNIKSEDEDIQNEFERLEAKLSLSGVEAEVFALYELKIMYSYKYFEIQLKQLYKNAFDHFIGNDFYNWDKIKDFYKGENISLSKLKCYNEVDQLRRVNNTLKHSNGRVTKEIKNIKEFKDLEFIKIGHLKNFYERVQEAPKEFTSALASTIYDQLFKNGKSTEVSKEFDIQDSELILPF